MPSANCLHACGAPRETALVSTAGVLPLSAIVGPMEPVHLGQRSVMVPPPLRYYWRLITVTPSHWQMQQRQIGATSSAGEWLLPQFTAGVLCGGQGDGHSEKEGRLQRDGEGEVWHSPQGTHTLELQGAVQDVPPAKQGEWQYGASPGRCPVRRNTRRCMHLTGLDGAWTSTLLEAVQCLISTLVKNAFH
ncbi:hypothetical protein DFH08DRAFT_820251 [Mycena albidolilacea]|uniref:Uncharacterized protein n=1 Tax=Mycena albidolilacea TaxID=1033008 RepID=A0AAD6ZCJ6_9AGAR|nr:hypothetical protein DFH08DRAFT_820251 [Mycena albidolilacea]